MKFLGFLGVLLFSATASFAAPVETRFEKMRAVLEHYGITDDYDFYGDLKIWDGAQTRKAFDTIIKHVDPKNYFARYATWDDEKLTLFRDRDSKKVVDYSLNFKQSGAPSDPKGLIAAIRNAKNFNPSTRPLEGLRVALDPGHMGGRYWDSVTGKFVAVGNRRVSEGTIALHVCLILARELENLGATVMLTRYGYEPATAIDMKSYELAPYAAREIRQNTDQPWFDMLLARAPIGNTLFSIFDQSPSIRNIKSPAQREEYFIHRVDLQARADKINAFKPNLTLIVHFDASNTKAIQNQVVQIRTYVPGNMLPQMAELSSREQRANAVRILLDGHRWMESHVFSASVVAGISDVTKIRLKTEATDIGGVKVADGIYARNLALNRLVSEGIMTFLEVMNYDYAPEYIKLSTLNRHTVVETPTGPMKLDYSSRIDDIVEGMKRGILNYVFTR